ncbi:glycosyltransferase family 2 protein [Chitinophaga sp. 212800010-3]|uniref:glycosyltransferase family 2 protein n=1 Tax=unclassified Chitinophaga TaxID=2619133 RepID=UPI002DF155C4|nr:Glycosyltransferase, catalytic subunit of cellulose synthase and poly-beta-1,6-N-acetylglucosamine synthase [Chitinophaga sp. 212800010-3]
MLILSVLFWLSVFIVFYSYIGYAILLYITVRVKRLLRRGKRPSTGVFRPEVTFLVAAYNEEDFIADKIMNSLQQQYPADRLHFIFVTDGSSDQTNEIVRRYPAVTLLYRPERGGKMAAINRAMSMVTTPFVVFSDANTLLNREATGRLMDHFADERVGAVAGEKKVLATTGGAEAEGEGMYWKYESALKKWDAELYSVMGAAGELIAIRTSLYEQLPDDTILDDFMLSFRINMKGYTVMYEPDAYAMETSSASLKEEYKRKVRISAGGFQSMSRLLPLLNPFRYPKITWQYISHRVLRWTLAPLCLLLALITNMLLLIIPGQYNSIYVITGILQGLFYLAALSGYILARKNIKAKYLYVPFYFVFMNVAVYIGFGRFLRKKQSAIWERSQRSMAVR